MKVLLIIFVLFFTCAGCASDSESSDTMNGSQASQSGGSMTTQSPPVTSPPMQPTATSNPSMAGSDQPISGGSPSQQPAAGTMAGPGGEPSMGPMAGIPSEPATGGADTPMDDIDALFSPPREDELAAVGADWDSRDTSVKEWNLVARAQFRGFDIDLVSHRVDGNEHYGAIRLPANYDPNRRYPVLIVNHGGNNGTGPGIFGPYSDNASATSCMHELFVISASYRSEELTYEQAMVRNYLSGGDASVIDRDVDDVISLLNGVLANYPAADPERIVVTGGSRGGGVSHLLSVRDDRIKAAAIYYGATNHLHESVASAVRMSVEMGQSMQNPVTRAAMDAAVTPFLDGSLTLADARLALIRRSAYFFAERMPAMQIHHGTDDTSVPIVQSEVLAEKMMSLGRQTPQFEYFAYPGGIHSPASLPNSRERIQTFLCGIVE